MNGSINQVKLSVGRASRCLLAPRCRRWEGGSQRERRGVPGQRCSEGAEVR